jgi:hypothetical protein
VAGSPRVPPAGDFFIADYAGPQLIHLVEPVAPDSLLAVAQDTVVRVFMEIDTAGVVVAAWAIDGDSLLFEPALDAVRQWRFRPYGWPDRKMPANVAVPVVFRRSPPN